MATTNNAFVVKNGLVVNGNLITANNGQVGINNSSPDANVTITGTANVQGNAVITGITTLQSNVNVSGNSYFTGVVNATANILAVNVYATNLAGNLTGNVLATTVNATSNVVTTNVYATYLSATSNVVTSNVYATYISATSNVVASNVYATNLFGNLVGNVTGNLTTSSLSLSNNLTVSNTLSVSGNTTIGTSPTVLAANATLYVQNTYITGNVTITGNLNVSGTTTYTGTSAATGSFIPGTNNSFSLGSTANVWQNVYSTNVYANTVNASQNVITTNVYATFINVTSNVVSVNVYATNLFGNLTGNVAATTITLGGLAVATQSYVTGLGYLTTSSSITGTAYGLSISGTGNYTFASPATIGSTTANTGTFTQLNSANLTTSTNTVTIGTGTYFTASGNVGINTNSPGYQLVSYANTNSGPSLIQALNSNTGAASYAIIRADTGPAATPIVTTILQSGTTAGYVGTTQQTIPFNLIANNQVGLTVAANLNVGIGTATPGTLLTVSGAASVTSLSATTVTANLTGNVTATSVAASSTMTLGGATVATQTYISGLNFANATNNLAINGSANNATYFNGQASTYYYQATNPSAFANASNLSPIGGSANVSTYTSGLGVISGNIDLQWTTGMYGYATTSTTGTKPTSGTSYGTVLNILNSGTVHDNSTNWLTQLAFDTNATGPFYRNKINSSAFTPWYTILTSANYTNFSPSLTGAGASGNWSINITGSAGSAGSATNAGTATNVSGGGTVSATTISGTTITATTQFSGPGTGLTGTASSLTVGTATNATQLGGVAASSYYTTSNPYNFANATNGFGLSSGQITGALGFTPYNSSTNPSGYLSSAVTSAVAGTGVSVSGATGAVTFSIGQAVGTSSSVQFGSLGVGISATGAAGEIRATNNITAYSASDIRLKTNITNIANAMFKVNTISGVEFDWTDEYIEASGGEDGYFVRKHDVGVIAQEIKKVLPEAVGERGNGILAVKYERIVPLLIEAIKELKAEVDELKAKVK